MRLGRVAAGWLGLIALYTLVQNADTYARGLGWATNLTNRLADPSLALVPRVGTGGGSGYSTADPTKRDNSTAGTYDGGGYYNGSTFVPTRTAIPPGQTVIPGNNGGKRPV